MRISGIDSVCENVKKFSKYVIDVGVLISRDFANIKDEPKFAILTQQL